jgi:hypothetical protein
MESALLTFQKFHDMEVAEDIAEKLRENNIYYELVDESPAFDVSYAYNFVSKDIRIKLKPWDFVTARNILDEYYKGQIDKVDETYYLFSFSNDELKEIISKPDEWGYFDYQLAQKILRDRGDEIKPAVVGLLKEERNKELGKTESMHKKTIARGYYAAFLGGFWGFVIGHSLVYSRKTLPDGRSVYTYPEEERTHGINILIISSVCVVLWTVVIIVKFFISLP